MNDALEPIDHVLRAYADSVFRKDPDAFAAIYDSDVRVFDAWDSWRSDGKSAVREMAKNWFGSLGEKRVEVVFSEVQGRVESTMAFASAWVTYAAITPTGTRLHAVTNRITLVLHHGPDGWRVVHEHTSVPVEFGSKQVVPFA